MKTKIISILALLILVSGGYLYYSSSQKSAKEASTDTPTSAANSETTETSKGKVEGSIIKVVSADGSEQIIFHKNSGYTFTSYTENNVTDKIIASKGDIEVLQLGVNWLGYTGGTLGLQQVILIKNPYIGDVYRATGGGIADGGYVLTSKVKTTGKCTNDNSEVTVPCTDSDQLRGKNGTFTYLTFCLNLEEVAACDELMSGLEIKKL